MSGHVAKPRRRWPWVILCFLFALAFAWSFAVSGEQVGGVWSILRIGSAVGLGISLLLLVLTFISSRRLRRAEGDEGSEIGADGQQPGDQPPTDERAPTYEEVFGLDLDLDEGSLPLAPEDEGWPGDASTSEEDVQAPDADLDEAVDHLGDLDPDDESQEHLRRMREEFRARAEEAALRVKQRETGLEEAASVPDPKR